MQTKNPFVLIVLDGWGLSPERYGNAITLANTPAANMLTQNYPHMSLSAAGISAGLPWGEVGNSEVGHLSIGSGRIIYQNLPRISLAIEDGSFFENIQFLTAIEHAKKNKKPLHLMGLVSDGGVHSHIEHLLALIKLAKEKDIPVRLHIFTDGRDTDRQSAIKYIKKLESAIADFPDAKIATLMGRAIAMDRNSRWDFTKKAYECLAEGTGAKFDSAEKAIQSSYDKGATDEFIEPCVINSDASDKISKGSSVISFNFREDRARQITKAFVEDNFNEFSRNKISDLYFVSMVEYEKGLCENVAFPPISVRGCLAEVLNRNGLSQLHIAETEKYAHVTYFFNGGVEQPRMDETWHMIPSRPDGDYEKHPQMSSSQIAAFVEEAINADKFDFILINFANADMVGHTGNLKAAISAVEEIDRCLDQLLRAGQKKQAIFLITADHGNAESMIDPRTGNPLTDHTANPVPCWIVTPENKSPQAFADFNFSKSSGILADIAPTVLDLMGIEKPEGMTGESLLKHAN